MEIPWPRDRTRRVRTRDNVETGNRQVLATAALRAASNRQALAIVVPAAVTPATVAPEQPTRVRIEVEVEVGIVWAIVAFQAAVAPAAPAHSEAARVDTVAAARGAAVHAVPPAWARPGAVLGAAAGGGGE